MMTDSRMNLAASAGGAGSSEDLMSSNRACGKAMQFPRSPPCLVLLGAFLSGSAMTLLTHMRPRASDFSVMSLSSSPSGANANGIRPIQLSSASAYLGIATFCGLSALSANDVIEVVALSIFSATTVQWTSLLGDYAKIPSVTSTERNALTAVVGMLVYNTTLGIMQQYASSGWASIDSPPTVSSLNYPGDDTALDIAGEFNLTSSTTANGDATITVSSTTALKQGMAVSGTGIPANATVLSITDSTHFELSANATATATTATAAAAATSARARLSLNGYCRNNLQKRL